MRRLPAPPVRPLTAGLPMNTHARACMRRSRRATLRPAGRGSWESARLQARQRALRGPARAHQRHHPLAGRLQQHGGTQCDLHDRVCRWICHGRRSDVDVLWQRHLVCAGRRVCGGVVLADGCGPLPPACISADRRDTADGGVSTRCSPHRSQRLMAQTAASARHLETSLLQTTSATQHRNAPPTVVSRRLDRPNRLGTMQSRCRSGLAPPATGQRRQVQLRNPRPPRALAGVVAQPDAPSSSAKGQQQAQLLQLPSAPPLVPPAPATLKRRIMHTPSFMQFQAAIQNRVRPAARACLPHCCTCCRSHPCARPRRLNLSLSLSRHISTRWRTTGRPSHPAPGWRALSTPSSATPTWLP